MEGWCWANFFAPTGAAPRSCSDVAHFVLVLVLVLVLVVCAMRSPFAACRRRVGALDGVILPDWWRRGRNLRTCNAQVADHLGEKRRKWATSGKVVCVLGATMSGMVCWSHVNPLLRAVTRYIARKPAIESVGGAAQARISGLTCALAGPGAYKRVNVRISGPTCALKGRGHHLSDSGARKRGGRNTPRARKNKHDFMRDWPGTIRSVIKRSCGG